MVVSKFSPCAGYGNVTVHMLTVALRCHVNECYCQCPVSVGGFYRHILA